MVAGVDGCRGGWIIVYSNNNLLQGEMLKDINELLDFQRRVNIARIAIDIPVGLPAKEKIYRNVDKKAKELLKERSSSVFFAPIAELVKYKEEYDYQKDYKEICEESIRLTGKKISRQIFCIFNKLQDVEKHKDRMIKNGFIEFHPELCWKNINSSKKKASGYKERLKEIASELNMAEEEVDNFIKSIRNNRCKIIAKDDVIDALCGLIVAKKYLTESIKIIKESDTNSYPSIYYW